VLAGDAAVAHIAGTQHRAVSIEQLSDAGLSRNAIAHRLKHGGLRRLWRGVYLVGPGTPGPLSFAMGAILTCGADAAISHLWAAHLWALVPRPDLPVDVTIARGSHRGRPEVRVHRTLQIDPRDFTTRWQIPVTTAARALVDVAPVLSSWDLERAVAEAQVLKLVTEQTLRDTMNRSGRKRSLAKLGAILAGGPELTRADSERILRRLLREAGLPQPRTNFRLGRWEADFYWPDHRLVVEVDGFAAHAHRRAFEKDHRKGAELTAAGYRVMGFTYRQLVDEPHFVVAQIAGALARAAA
jgi:very-short-patch-repair endonuclease